MSGIHDLALFVVSGVLLNLTPGADTLYIVARSTSMGTRAGVAAALGIAAGCCVHIVAAALGLSALLAASGAAFAAVKLVGAAYLLYLGISLWRAGPGSQAGAAGSMHATSLRVVFVQGMLTNVLNPKVALFFLAFLPQFVDARVTYRFAAFLLLGTLFNATGLLWNLFVAWSAAGFGRRMQGLQGRLQILRRISGVVFFALGIKLASSARDAA